MKKIIAVLLFVTIVSNKGFSQNDTIVKTIGYVDGIVNDINDTYRLSKYVANLETIFHFTKDSIVLNNFENSVFKINETINGIKVKGEDELLKMFVCKDKNNTSCYFFSMLNKNNEKYYIIEYSNVVYFYYTKI